MINPTIDELQNDEKYEKLAELSHNQIKEFVINQLSQPSRMITGYMLYQVMMIITGLFFFARAVIFALRGIFDPLYYTLAALVFTFTFLIFFHEMLHGLALKITGAKKLSFGAYWKKFIFYAEADRHVLNRNQFKLVALTPLVVVKSLTAIGILLFFAHPVFYFFIFVMSAHSLFCAGDIGLLSIFYRYKNEAIFTFDVKAEKRSYFFKRVSDH
ncbi:MAG TPA: DUF3267 domain-containing protein [Prolixibacteraceae bacterium]|nr:DUF3267 domain-containing protein [Prolixibacteraceae bacterium]